MDNIKFDTNLKDSQVTEVMPIEPEQFDFEAYGEYEAKLLESNGKFLEADSGLLVYRRVRANGVFYDKCRDYKESLALQLGALQFSMSFKADIPNFLEPWYGIGYIASCFGSEYIWMPSQAPAVKPKFSSAKEILNSDYIPIAQTPEGRYNLEMIEYFMEKSKGRLPISFGDLQSPFNMLSYLLPVTDLFLEIYDEPEAVKEAAELCGELLIDFMKEQKKIIGDALASPGHGFASSRAFSGVGLSDDNSIMIGTDAYDELFKGADERIGDEFGGFAYHSCGNWESKIPMVKSFRNICCADGAFSIETDPMPNNPEVFADEFTGSGIVLNARAVGNAQNSFEVFNKLWRPKQKLICVTYCKTPEEQEVLYDKLHEMESVN